MIFGAVPLGEAEGAILAHSVALPSGRLKKGQPLGAAELAALRAAGHRSVVAARLEPQDVPEDAAAARIGAALAPNATGQGLDRGAPFTGRLNLFAAGAGLFEVDASRVAELNALHEAVTLATLPDASWVTARQMVATVKIIPYAAPEEAVARAEALLAGGEPALRVMPRQHATAGLLLTTTPGMKPSVVEKGADAVRRRLRALGITLAGERVVEHETGALAAALADCPGEMLLILTASATSDRSDVGPAALTSLGGALERFGMPVDPGNLLFLGRLGERPVIGLPGCARSPKLNGADWVLERVAAGRAPDAAAIGAMGVGGLLKEIPSRPAPRAAERSEATVADETAAAALRPRIVGLLLAAGASRRMGGRDKLLEDAGGEAMIARAARALASSGVDEVIAVLRPGAASRHAALAGLGLRTVENARAEDGMGTSIAAGLAAVDPAADGVLIALADMPELEAGDHARLIAAFDPAEGREIVRAAAADGTPGNPVLIGRRFFEPLRLLAADEGARAILNENADFVTMVRLAGRRALVDLDTPEAWAAWRQGRAG
ncbi:MAG: molybdopterin-binding/glycosyltransferase family 2 protein [Pseudomonadota bacterium]